VWGLYQSTFSYSLDNDHSNVCQNAEQLQQLKLHIRHRPGKLK
jgi:hypothetical protein